MKTRPTIGLLCRGWSPDVGSVEAHAEGLARALTAAGYRVTVLTTERDPERADHAVRDTMVRGLHVRRMNRPVHAPRSLEDLAFDARAEAVLREWLVNEQPDLVHVQQLDGFGLGTLEVLDRAKVPSVLTLHDYRALCPRAQMLPPDGVRCEAPRAAACAACIGETWLRLSPTALEAAGRTSRALALLRRVDRLVAPSAAARNVFVRAGLERDRIAVCEPGIEPQRVAMETALHRRGLPRGRWLGVLGPLRPASGALELARAVVSANVPVLTLELHGSLGPDCGGDASYVHALRDLAEREPVVRVHGPYESRDLPRVLATLDAVAVPARWEQPDARIAREARAAGLPVLAARRGALEDLADDPGVTLVDGADRASWVRALRAFSFDPVAPPAPRGLLATVEELLGVYHEAWTARRGELVR